MRKILVIDDEESFSNLVKESLDSKIYIVDTALDGVSGLKKISESKPDLILLDLNMPGMDGMTFLKALRGNNDNRDIPVIITSNLSSMDKITEGVVLGVRGYIVKSNESLKQITKTIDLVFK